MQATAKDSRFWDRAAAKYAAHRIGDQAGYERTVARTIEYLKPTDRVLEFACGTGSTALRIAPHVDRLVASDISGAMIAIAREKAAAAGTANLEFVHGALDEGAWPAGSFDTVMVFNGLHLVRDLPETLRLARDLLKPGGLLISKTPCLGDMNPLIRLLIPGMQLIGKAPHVNVLSADRLARAVAAAGFEIVAQERHGSKGKDARPFIVARRP